MKALTILGLLQSACIVFLIYKVTGSGSTADSQMRVAEPASVGTISYASEPRPPLDEERLRQIIREELASRLSTAAESGGKADSAVTARVRDPAEARQQKELVDRQIAHYSSVGRISEDEMENLQRDIARLDQAGRKEMLGKLMRAMNSREIEGHM